MGSARSSRDIPVVHQDLTATSYSTGGFDAVVHAEVLEHVPDWRAMLAETARLTAPGGVTVFTAPFRAHAEETLIRATVDAEGTTTHLLEPEIHGAPLSPEGVLVYQVPGWDLLDELRHAGFRHPEVGWLYDPDLGLTSSNSDFDNHIEPVVFQSSQVRRASVFISVPVGGSVSGLSGLGGCGDQLASRSDTIGPNTPSSSRRIVIRSVS